MKKLRKATEDEKRNYKGIYPLYGFLLVDGVWCAIEFPNEGKEGPKYELMSPDSKRFQPYGTTSICCFSLKDVKSFTDETLKKA